MSTKATRIRFPTTWKDGTGRQHFADTEFTLGTGPCGKDVTSLAVSVSPFGAMKIAQRHKDGSMKVFMYPAATILGRVEVEVA